MGGHIACIKDVRNAYKILVGKPEGNRPLGISRRRRRIALTCNLTKIRSEDVV
jgi:hypothetical protein